VILIAPLRAVLQKEVVIDSSDSESEDDDDDDEQVEEEKQGDDDQEAEELNDEDEQQPTHVDSKLSETGKVCGGHACFARAAMAAYASRDVGYSQNAQGL
jgi:hypothetical protein